MCEELIVIQVGYDTYESQQNRRSKIDVQTENDYLFFLIDALLCVEPLTT
jgi:hypothetical protein